jgi:hypothetical protein
LTDQTEASAPKAPKVPVTAGHIRAAMLKRWPATEYAIMWEVAPATGAVRGSIRYADAVMMSLWPSRGLDLHGVEIKVSRSDWKREALDPTKAERIAAYCDFWWLHVGPGVIQDLSEVPMAWGVRHFDGTTWKTLREATRTAAKPCDRGFLASLLRRSDEARRADARDVADQMVAADREAYERRVSDEVARRTRGNVTALKAIEEFEAASGMTLTEYSMAADAKEIGQLVQAIRKAGLVAPWQGVQALRHAAVRFIADLDKGFADSGLNFEKPTLAKRKRK